MTSALFLCPLGIWCSYGPGWEFSWWSHDARQQPWHELSPVHGAAGLPGAQQGLHAAGDVWPAERGLPDRARVWWQVRGAVSSGVNSVSQGLRGKRTTSVVLVSRHYCVG